MLKFKKPGFIKKDAQTTWNALPAQKKRAFVVGGALSVCIMAFLWPGGKSVTAVSETQSERISTADKLVDIQDIWLYRSQDRLDSNTQALEALKAEIEAMHIIEDDAGANDAIHDLQAQINNLTSLLEQSQAQVPGVLDNDVSGDDNTAHKSPAYNTTIVSRNYTLSSPPITKTATDYIPLGSFAQAILLNGLDASTATTASSNPLPVLMRLTSDAVLPRQFRGQMKTCHVIAGAYGELSTTRVMMRLETITCTDLQGNIFESEIEGYITGDDGSVGVLGTMRDDTGPLLAKSFAAGLLGGIGQGIADSTGTTSTSALGTVQTYDTSEIMKMGLGDGASNALDRLAQYYIDRAEQIYPVIQIAPGRKITLIISGSHGLELTQTNES